MIATVLSLFTPEAPTVEENPQAEVELNEAMSPQELLSPIHFDSDTNKPKNPNDRQGDATTQKYVTPLYLGNPKNLEVTYELSEDGKGYYIYEKVGGINVRPPSYISREDFLKLQRQRNMQEYFREQSLATNIEQKRGLELNIDENALTDVFGGGPIIIRPTGYATLDFSLDHNRTDNPSLPQRQQRTTGFNFDQQIQLGVDGQIGDRMKLLNNFDTQATFDFENILKLEHNGTEDQILQSIKAGNINMNLGNSLIQGRNNLFGLKGEFLFGPVRLTALASLERGKVDCITVGGGGAIETPFEKEVTEYDQNRHFFLSHYFRSVYEETLRNLPIVQSRVRINRIEVWIEQQGATRNTRNAVGFIDLGENDNGFGTGSGVVYNENVNSSTATTFPDNAANDLYDLIQNDPNIREQSSAKGGIEALGLDMQNTADFQVLGNMRRLNSNEYSLNTQLGYISLSAAIPTDQVLFVAFNGTVNGQPFQVGEFSDDVPSNGLNSNVLFLKMLKSSVLRTNPYPAWDLMMKNIYNIGYGLEQEGFFLDIKYESGTSAGKINYLPDGPVKNVPLVQVAGVDRLTNHTAPNPDNFFDYVEGITVKSDRGLIIFPVLEPFGSRLADQLDNDPEFVDKYVFNPLYDGTVQDAIQKFPQLNRFTFEGFYRSAGGGTEIQLNTFNLSSESVTVKVGGRTLSKGVDYQIDEFGGKITFLNTAVLSSGQEIQVCFESSALYQVQTKILSGARAEYNPSQNLILGATVMNLKEQPFTQKTILGEEPVSNTLWGLDASFRKESDYITKMLDRLPLITTKETSTIDAAIETAQFIPGQPRIVRNQNERGIVYLDDFEAAANPYSLQGLLRWKLASFPEDESGEIEIYDPTVFYTEPTARNFSRAKLAWYQIDQIFYQTARNEIPESNLSDNYTRQVRPNEIFPTATRAFGQNIQPTFDLRFTPKIRGPYNYQTDPDKIDASTGEFVNPKESWAGITREMDVNNDFEATNIEFVEFWLMDPFMDNPNAEGGDFFINLGLVNEDVLDDESLSQEHGLPGATDTSTVVQPTPYGVVSVGNPPTQNFSNIPEDRVAQDVGYDGLDNASERDSFKVDFLDKLQSYLNPTVFQALQEDPSSDDFIHFRADTFDGDRVDILTRYDKFNGLERNSPIGDNTLNFTRTGQQNPDTEDLNGNGSLNFAEQYWEYKISMRPEDLERGQNYVVDRIDTTITTNGVTVPVTWYQFRVPLTTGRPVNGITNFKTISFMRMIMANFNEDITMRMTEFQLIASNWRRFADDLSEPGVILPNPEPPFTDFELGTVSLEENSQKLPFNYSLPPGIIQQAVNGNTAAGFLQDERSLVLKACNLEDGDARGIFKVVKNDLRLYERLKMFIHAESVESGINPSNFNERGDARMFIRLGLDNDQNYYEYEWPLTPSDPALGASNVENVWLADNEMNIDLSLMATAKADRNAAGTGLIYRHAFRDTSFQNDEVIYVKGTPKLSDVRNIMIGVRNPSDPEGEPICIEVWINELRMTDFDQKKGYGLNANASFNLGGFMNINATGSYRSAGFGPLEQKLSERSQEDVLRWDLSGQLDLDRFFPKRWGLQMPVYATWGEQRIDPQFNPQEADVRTDKLVETLDREAAREKLQEIQDYRRTRSIAFNNWRKQKTRGQNAEGGVPSAPQRPRPNAAPGGKNAVPSYPWDVSNFDFSFAYSETFARSAVIEKRFTTQYRGGINYRYNFPQISLQPFKGVKKSQFLSSIKFNPLPTSVSVAVNGDRQFEERIMRPTSLFGGITDPTYSKNFLINRNYNLVWNLSRSLQLNYTANNVARVDEVRSYWDLATQAERDSVGSLSENLLRLGKDPLNGHDQLVNFGRTTSFNHNLSVGFQLPTQNIKPFNWISATVNYTGSFQWQQAPEINPGLGSTISNGQRIQAQSRLDLNSLYRKFKPLKAILDEQSRPVSTKELEEKRKAKLEGPRTRIVGPEPPPTFSQSSVSGDSTETDPFKALKFIGRELGRIALSIRSVDLTYNRDASTILPGYIPRTDNFGLDWEFRDPITGNLSPVVPPTWGYVFGDQADIRPIAAQNNWITRDTTLANLFMRNNKETITARTSVELFKGFRVDLNATRSVLLNESEFYRWVPSIDDYASFDPLKNGNFSMSYIFANTAFKRSNLESFETFKLFSDTRQVISRRYAQANPNGNNLSREGLVQGGYQNGYLGTQQDVLITSFLAAYGARDAENVELTPFPVLPLPNWSINYNGLNNLPFIKEYFNSFTFRHAYRATYQIGNYANNLNAVLLGGAPFAVDTVGTDPDGNLLENFFSEENIQIASINEQFSPFIGLNFGLKNGITGQLDYKKGRQLSLSLGSMQLTELRNEDFSLMFGYRKDKLNWSFRAFGRDFDLQNSANFQFRATVRDTREITRYVGDESLADTRPPVYTRGTLNVIVSPSIDYVVNTRLNVKVYYEQNINNPYVANAFRTSFASFGVQVRFTLAQ